MLDDEQIAAVWAAHIADRAAVEPLEILVQQYARLAGYLARRALAKAPAYQDSEDILSYAQHGLLDAIRRFDPEVGVKFETYATRRITGAILDGQRKQDPLKRPERRRVKLIQAAREELWERWQRDPSTEELAEHLKETPEAIRQALLFEKSLAGQLDEAAEGSGIDSEAEVVVRMAEARSYVAGRLSQLAPRARAFVLAYYCDERTLPEACRTLEISNDWGRQTRNQVLDSLAR